GLSDDGTVAASWFVYPAPPPIRCLVLHSWCGDGRVFVTMRGGSESHIPPPPWLHTRRLAAETRTADAVRSHRERVAAAAGAPRSLAGGDELLAARTAEEAMIASSAARRASSCSSRCCVRCWVTSSRSAAGPYWTQSGDTPSGGPGSGRRRPAAGPTRGPMGRPLVCSCARASATATGRTSRRSG